MTLDITVTDLFCGAGGSSIGAEAAGARLVMAANHWRLAIDAEEETWIALIAQELGKRRIRRRAIQ
jgi:predicted RNA methylase